MGHPSSEKIIVGMSGGVDSSVTAYLLMQQGYQVEGLFMKNWEEDDTEEYCSASEDLADAQQVCDTLGIQITHGQFFRVNTGTTCSSISCTNTASGALRIPTSCATAKSSSRLSSITHRCSVRERIATGHYVRTRKLQRPYGRIIARPR